MAAHDPFHDIDATDPSFWGTPTRLRAFGVFAGLSRFAPLHHEWLRARLTRTMPDRLVTASPFLAPVLVAGAAGLAGRPEALGGVVALALVVAVLEPGPWRRWRHRQVLRAHGLADPPMRSARWSPSDFWVPRVLGLLAACAVVFFGVRAMDGGVDDPAAAVRVVEVGCTEPDGFGIFRAAARVRNGSDRTVRALVRFSLPGTSSSPIVASGFVDGGATVVLTSREVRELAAQPCPEVTVERTEVTVG